MSSEIKTTIGLLCKILNLLHKTHLKPEYFRLAKFNKTDENVIPILWNLLYKILNENDIGIIRNKLHLLNYKRKEFYSCTETLCESRELLLVIGFLLTHHLEERINAELKYTVSSIDFNSLESSCYLGRKKNQQFEWKKLNEEEIEHYRAWICGKTCLNMNRIHEFKHCILKIQEKFNKLLDLKANEKLTVCEILALKNKTFGEQFIIETDPVINILGVYTEWLKKEKYFWKWMESVLLEEKKELKSKLNI